MCERIKKRFYFVWIGLLGILTVFPVKTVSAVNYKFRHYTVEDGLTSNTIRSILQDRTGYIWVATSDGLNRLAGSVFKTFRHVPHDPHSIPSNEIWSLHEDSTGCLWAGSKGGVYLYDTSAGNFRTFDDKGLFRPYDIFRAITEDRAGNIWMCASGNGLFRYDKKLDTLIHYSRSAVPQAITNILTDHAGRVWCVPEGGKNIFLYHPETDSFGKIRLYDSIARKEFRAILSMCEDSQGNIWLGGNNSTLMKMDTERRNFTFISPGNSSNKNLRIRCILEDEPGKLLLGTSNGILIYDYVKKSFEKIDSDPRNIYGLNDVFVHALLKDQEGGIWAGTYFGGLNYLSPINSCFEYYPNAPVNGVSEHFIVSKFCEDKQGNIWIGSDNGGLGKFVPKTGKFTHLVIDPDQPALNIHALYADEQYLWVGTYLKGIYRRNHATGKIKHYPGPTSLTAFYKDVHGQFWAGGRNAAFVYDEGKDRFIKVVEAGVNCEILDITDDKNGIVWFASHGGGLISWDPLKKIVARYSSGEDQPDYITNRMRALCFYRNRLWVGTSGHGLWFFNTSTKRLEREFVNEEFDLTSVYCIIPHDSQLWITTSKGLARYDIGNGKIIWYNEEDGLQGRVFNPNAGIKSTSGKIYIGGSGGFNIFDPDRMIENDHIPNIVFTGFQIAGEEIPVGSNGILTQSVGMPRPLKLEAEQNAFTVHFTALSYAAPSKMDYRYRLKGFEHEWKEIRDKQNVAVSYTNLPSGKYLFEVMTGRNAGNWYTPGLKLDIEILPPWWKTGWMKLIYLLFTAGSVAGMGIFIRRKIINRQKSQLQELKQKNDQELLESKIRIFQEIAHEIRTPVTLIAAPAEEILTLPDLPGNIRENLEIIKNNSGRLVELMNQVLDFSRTENKYARAVRLQIQVGVILGNIIDRFKSCAKGKGVNILLHVPEKQALTAKLDVEAFDKIVSNLMSNALKFTHDRIEITLTPCGTSHFNLTIWDNGIGIREGQNIFDLFYHAPQENVQEFKGFGIGLAVVSLLLKKMNATVRVESQEGEFTAFCLQFPLGFSETEKTEEPILAPDAAPTSAPVLPATQERAVVLVVEDNPELRHFLAKSLSSYYQVHTAAQGSEALDILQQTDVDIVVSDVVMPVMDGWELCRQIKNNVAVSHIPIIMLTARTDVESKIVAIENGADVYIEKPVVMKYLYARIAGILEKRKQLQELFSKTSSEPLHSVVKNEREEAFILKLNQIVENNISNSEFSMDEIADQLFMSRSAMYAKIKAISGQTPNNFVRLMRLRKAAELLRSGENYKINEVCYLVGFSSPSYFAKCFQQQFGILPGDFVNIPDRRE